MPPDSSDPWTPSPPAPSSPRIPGDRPAVVSFLPLIYVAWADGILAPDELEAICARIEASAGWIEGEDRKLLTAWLRPQEPPSASALETLRARLRSWARDLPPERRSSLTELGVGLARSREPSGPWDTEKVRGVLAAVEEELGVAPSEAARELLGGDGRPSRAPGPPAFDVEGMTRFLDGPRRPLRREIFELLARPELRFPPETGRAEYRARVLEATRTLAEAGHGLHAFPEAVGGNDDPEGMIAVFETLAYGDLSLLVKFGVQFGLFGGSVLQLGTRRHHERWLEAIGRLELPGCFAMTERGHGSNVRALKTTATYDPEQREFVVETPTPEAWKDWAGKAALHGRMATVFARLVVQGEDHGVHAFLVPIRDEEGELMAGVTAQDCGPKVGLNGVDNGRLAFGGVRIPRENLLDRFGSVSPEGAYTSPIPSSGKRFFTMLGTLVGGRISIAAASVSAAKTALAVAVPYSAARRQFGPAGEAEVPILDYRVHQRLLLPRLATAYGLHFAVRDLIDRYASEDGEGDEEDGTVEVRAAGLKAYASRYALETIQACREACGGRGYLAENRLGRLRSDVDVFTTFEGANPVLLQLVAKGLLSDFREEMGDLRLWDIVRWVAERAATNVAELNPVIVRKTDEEHLRDPAFHRSAFEYRERRLLVSAARRLKARIDEGEDTFRALNACQDHVVSLARAHVERIVLDAFQEGVVRAPEPGLSEVLRQLATLFALSRIEEDRGWFLEAGYLGPAKSKAIRALVNRILGDVRSEAVPLVRAFGIPPEVLEAPAAGLAVMEG